MGLEPEKYFKAEGRQWWSAKQGEWIDPTQEIKMDGMKPKDAENGEEKEILDETNQFIEKLDAVERDRKESEASEVSVKARVNILVHQASVVEGQEDTYSYKAAEDTCSLAGAEETDPQVYYKENGYPEKSYNDADDVSIKSFSAKELDEDAQSIFAGVGEDSKTVFEGGEVATEYSLYKKTDDGLDISGDYHIVERGVMIGKTNVDNVSVKSLTVQDDGDNVSLRSLTLRKAVGAEEDEDDNESVKTLTEDDTNEVREDVTEGATAHYSYKVIDYNVTKEEEELNTELDNVSVKSFKKEADNVSINGFRNDADNISIKSLKNDAENVSIKSFKNDADNVSIKSFKNEDDVDSHSIRSFKNDADNISIKSFKNDEDNVSVKSLVIDRDDADEDIVSVKSLKMNNDDNMSVKSLQEKEPEDDNVSIKSYAIEGDYILSLHQRVPVAAPREIRNHVEAVAAKEEETNHDDDTDSVTESVTEKLSYEEERARTDFESLVRENVSRNKSDKGKTNIEVLEDIAREDAEDRPNVAKLLAWAKGTKKPMTDTFVIRKKNREELLRKSVDTGAFEVVIQDRVTEQNGVKTINTGKKKFEVDNRKSQFEVCKTSEIHPETIVTQEWIEKAISEFESESSVSVNKMDFTLVSKGVYRAVIEAVVRGAMKEYSWIIKDAPKAESAFDKDTFIVADLGRKMGSFVDGMRQKVPLGDPFPRVIYADKQYAIFPDISAYRPCKQSTLDETHLKAGVKALAKLHAISYTYFNRSFDSVKEFSEVLKLLVDRHYQPAATPEDKAEAKRMLEKMFEGIVTTMEKTGQVEQVKTMKNMLYNIYKEGRQSSSVFSVLCHGCPTVQNMVFLYNKEDIPVDAKLVNFSDARIASSMTDLHTFINTAGDNTRDDFLLRFVYYETLVTALKSLGLKNDIITFDDLKLEFVKKKLYAYIESSNILCSADKPSFGKRSKPVSMTPRSSNGNVVNSKILGKFAPKAVAVGALSPINKADGEDDDKMEKIVRMMTKAINIK